MVDKSKAFEVPEGLLLTDENGTEGPFITGGPLSPSGLDLPTNTIYLQNTSIGNILWIKFGAGSTDWIKYKASDVSFDPSLVDISNTSVQGAIEALSSRSFGKDFASKVKEVSESTSGGAFDEYDLLNFNVNESSGTNKYRVAANFFYGHNSASNDIRVRILLDNTVLYEVTIEPKDTGTDQRYPAVIVDYPENLANGSHTLSLEYRPASANRVSRMYRSVLEVWRVE